MCTHLRPQEIVMIDCLDIIHATPKAFLASIEVYGTNGGSYIKDMWFPKSAVRLERSGAFMQFAFACRKVNELHAGRYFLLYDGMENPLQKRLILNIQGDLPIFSGL